MIYQTGKYYGISEPANHWYSVQQDNIDSTQDIEVTRASHLYMEQYRHDKERNDGYNNKSYWIMLIATMGIEWEDMQSFFAE